ncbi:MAG: hypothetical protein US96_C0035G0005 [Candidatus Woesebacteria bacterium GW2011_GWB1_38_5b]|uniref:Uncharacterized protein n=1 Tax=Candidatus Woesebacteria bacterium GW2011_GWB1_38_5b TaxID=1618569 RepID=A0A0G0NB16_9BACT|nr:MAG: hypothetical protein US96_C0035G0005 [Candidatus Woesebacteria bacterium GW2011_GWB1_38_5b]
MLRSLLNKKYIALSFLAISFILTTIWFKEGKMLAKAEEEIPLYNLAKTVQIAKYSWQELGMGIPNVAAKPTEPTYQLLFALSRLGASSPDIQKLLFFFIIFLSLVSTYLLATELFRKFKNVSMAAFLASIYYLINPFVAINVWYRFLYPFMFSLPLLPLSLYFFVKGINERKIYYSLFFSLALATFAYSFSSPATVLLIALPLLIYWCYEFFGNNKNYLPGYVVTTFIISFVLNYWWIKGLISLPQSSEGFTTLELSLNALRSLSKFYTLPYVLRLLSLDFFQELAWGEVYKETLYQLISWSPFVISIVTFWKYRKKQGVRIVFLWALVAVFIANGSSGFLGNLFEFLFLKLAPLQLLRNPFEKIGLLLALSYSLLFGLGLSGLSKKLKIIFLGLVLFYSYPVLNGKIFETHGVSIATEVPGHYRELDDFIDDVGSYRIIQMPLMYSDGSIMKWDNPYHGGEPSHFLYDAPTIARNIGNDNYKNLYYNYLKYIPYMEEWKLAGLFSAKYIVVNRDIDYEKLNLFSPDKYADYLNNYYAPSDEEMSVCNKITKTEAFWECDVLPSMADFRAANFVKTIFKLPGKYKVKITVIDVKNQSYSWEETINGNMTTIRLYSPIENESNIYFENVQSVRVMVNNDVILSGIYLDSGRKIQQEHIHYIKTFGNLDLYKIDDEFLTSRIYSPSSIKKVKSPQEMFTDIGNSQESKNGEMIYLVNEELDISNIAKAKLEFTKISPEEYNINVKDAKKPFIIVFNETFNKGWKLYSGGDKTGKHFLVNASVNGFLVNPENKRLTLKFQNRARMPDQ